MNSLFRDEVLQSQHDRWLGEINLATPLSFRWWAVLAATLMIAIILFMAFGQYTSRETVAGQLVPEAGVLTLTSHLAGRITRARIREGEHVTAGQTLVDISGDIVSASMGNTHAEISAQLRLQKTQLLATLADLEPKATAQTLDLKSRIGMLYKQTQQIDDQLALQHQQIGVEERLVKSIGPLHERGIVSTVEFNQYHASMLAQQAQLKTLERQRLDTAQQSSSLQAQLSQLPMDTRARANQLHGQLAQLDEQIAKNEVERNVVLRAPLAGVVSTLLVNPGQTVTVGQPLLSLLPADSKLEAQLLVPTSAIGFISPGDRVVLRYQAYPYQKFGQYYGSVKQVSRSALSSAEGASLLGDATKSPLYRVLVALDRQTIHAYDTVEPLKPGMTVSADILLGRTNLWEWAFNPLRGLRQRLANDGGQRG